MSAALTYALRMEVVYRNPVQAVEPPKVVKKEVQPPSMRTVNKILSLAREDRSDMWPPVRAWLDGSTRDRNRLLTHITKGSA